MSEDDLTAQPPPPPPPPPSAAATQAAASSTAAPAEVDAPAAESPLTSERAAFQTTEATRTYPCDQCGGDLQFDIEAQKLKCPHCGHVADIAAGEAEAVVEHNYDDVLAMLTQGAAARSELQIDGEKEVVCQSCGGHTTFSGSLTATRCPYCATPIQRDDVHDAPARLPVDGVLPFAVGQKQADEAIKKWIKSRWFAPNEFKTYATTGSFSSLYCAYFTYDADTTTEYRGMRGDDYTVTVGSGENQRTETRTRWTPAWGTVRNTFDDLPVFANEGLERRHIEALEPWPTTEAKPFNPEFVAGHLCRTYDHDVQECFPRAKERMEDEIRNDVKRDIGGDRQQISSMSVEFGALGFKHLLLPIWLLTVLYAGQPFQVFINGVTGEVQGQRPYSKVKIALAVTAALIVALVLYLVFRSNGSASG